MSAIIEPTPRRTERTLLAVAGFALVAYALTELARAVGAGVAHVADRMVPDALPTATVSADGYGAWPLLALLAVPVAFRAGQYARGWGHARGIRQSHWRAIRGGH